MAKKPLTTSAKIEKKIEAREVFFRRHEEGLWGGSFLGDRVIFADGVEIDRQQGSNAIPISMAKDDPVNGPILREVIDESLLKAIADNEDLHARNVALESEIKQKEADCAREIQRLNEGIVKATNLIKAQDERIKELVAERDNLKAQVDAFQKSRAKEKEKEKEKA